MGEDSSRKELFSGIVYVTLGAAFYGLLATFVGLAYKEGYTTIEVVLSQYILGLVIVGGLFLYNLKQAKKTLRSISTATILKIIAGGTTLGLIGFLYAMSVRYIPVSIAVVLLMQSIWMSVILESVLLRKIPNRYQIMAIVLVLIGTLYATDAVHNFQHLDTKGVLLGLSAALTYAIMLMVSNRWGNSVDSTTKSFLMLVGANTLLIVLLATGKPLLFDISVFWKWGILLALLGSVLPPILFNKGMPKTGVALGAVIISIEIPVSVCMAYFLLHEQVLLSQWMGILLIIASIVLVNYKALLKK